MDKKKETMTEKELELAADKLLEEADSTPEKPSSEPKTQDELLSELLEKAKKSGKISTKEIAALEEKGVDAETISKRSRRISRRIPPTTPCECTSRR